MRVWILEVRNGSQGCSTSFGVWLCLSEQTLLANCMDLVLLLVLIWFPSLVGKAPVIVILWSPGPEIGDGEGRKRGPRNFPRSRTSHVIYRARCKVKT